MFLPIQLTFCPTQWSVRVEKAKTRECRNLFILSSSFDLRGKLALRSFQDNPIKNAALPKKKTTAVFIDCVDHYYPRYKWTNSFWIIIVYGSNFSFILSISRHVCGDFIVFFSEVVVLSVISVGGSDVGVSELSSVLSAAESSSLPFRYDCRKHGWRGKKFSDKLV